MPLYLKLYIGSDGENCVYFYTWLFLNHYSFAEAVLTSTHNLCFGAKIRNIGIPLQTPVLLYKIGVKGYTFHGHVFLMQQCIPSPRLIGTI